MEHGVWLATARLQHCLNQVLAALETRRYSGSRLSSTTHQLCGLEKLLNLSEPPYLMSKMGIILQTSKANHIIYWPFLFCESFPANVPLHLPDSFP